VGFSIVASATMSDAFCIGKMHIGRGFVDMPKRRDCVIRRELFAVAGRTEPPEWRSASSFMACQKNNPAFAFVNFYKFNVIIMIGY
jgi:hypothetical protein